MKVRRAAVKGVKVKVVFVDEATEMVTLEDPKGGTSKAKDAFVRLRPPESLTPVETRAWADVVRPLAKALRVLPSRRAAAVPTTSARADDRPVGTIREEVLDLLREADDPELHAVTEAILSEVDR